MSRHRHHQGGRGASRRLDNPGIVARELCPKCNGAWIEYYDHPLLCPIRTLTGRRRFRCRRCGFIWRRHRTAAWRRFLGRP